MTDWKQVAETLLFLREYNDTRENDPRYNDDYDAAIRLCKLAAKLPAGEAERVLEAAVENHLDEQTLRCKHGLISGRCEACVPFDGLPEDCL